ncbi:MAG: hypothetical protein ACRC8M_11925 [Cetobacterium sp.]|uniref:hypothetical protein n=1 Tax=Cetobacterium sp. TaxID=2071632 RepID=UPI003F33C741
MEAVKENKKSLKETILDLFKFEDYWAILLATIILIFCTIIYMGSDSQSVLGKTEVYNSVMKAEGERAPFKTVQWHEAQFDKNSLAIKTSTTEKVKNILGKPKKWVTNPIESIYLSESAAKAKGAPFTQQYEDLKKETTLLKNQALAATALAEEKVFADTNLNTTANELIDKWLISRDKENKMKAKAIVKPYNLIPNLVILLAFIGIYFSLGMRKMGRDREGFLQGFPAVFALATSAYLLGEQETLKAWGLGYVFWGLVLGLIVSNTVGTTEKAFSSSSNRVFYKNRIDFIGINSFSK